MMIKMTHLIVVALQPHCFVSEGDFHYCGVEAALVIRDVREERRGEERRGEERRGERKIVKEERTFPPHNVS